MPGADAEQARAHLERSGEGRGVLGRGGGTERSHVVTVFVLMGGLLAVVLATVLVMGN